MNDTQQLLAEYVRNGSDAAFRELVKRYIDLVYSAAVRLVDSDAERAKDVTQTVFVDLARKARTLAPGVMLGGWLHRHTCFVAATLMRSERRRLSRERQAVEMNTQPDHSAANLAQVAPILDDAINQLDADDRTAIMLRFFEQSDFRSVGEVLGSNEDAARMRVNRALEKLQSLLKQRGVACSAVALGSALGAQAVTAAPLGLATAVAGTALAGGAGAITFMTITKVTLIGAIAVAAVATPLAIQQHQNTAKLRDENRQQTEQLAQLKTENGRLLADLDQVRKAPAANPDQMNELLRLRGELSSLRGVKAEADKLRQENQKLRSRPTTTTTASTASPADEQRLACIENLRQIDGAKQQWALETRQTAESVPTAEQLLKYLPGKYNGQFPVCPTGGSYTLDRMDRAPTCSVPGHAIQ